MHEDTTKARTLTLEEIRAKLDLTPPLAKTPLRLERVPAWARAGHCATAGCTPTSTPELDQGKRLADPDPIPPAPAADWRTVRMPERFREAKIELDARGYPIFYTVHPGFMPADRKVDFRILNMVRHRECAEKRLCSVCGLPLPGKLFFIGGPMCVQNRIFGDGPLHEDCARYSMQVCPYLSIARKVHSQRPTHVGHATTHDPNVILNKPERICIYVCRQYRMIDGEGGKDVYVVEPADAVEWYDVSGSYICRTRPTRYSQ